MKREKTVALSVFTLLLSACLCFGSANAHWDTSIYTEHEICFDSVNAKYSSDWMEPEEGDWRVIRLEDWVIPEQEEAPADPGTGEPDPADPEDPEEPAPSDSDPADPEPGEEPGPSEEPETGTDGESDPVPGEGGEPSADDPREQDQGENNSLANGDDIGYDYKIDSGGEKRFIRFRVFAPAGETISEEQFNVSVCEKLNDAGDDFGDNLVAVDYLNYSLTLEDHLAQPEGNSAEIVLILNPGVYQLTEETELFIEIQWQGLYLQGRVRLIPSGGEGQAIIEDGASPDGETLLPLDEIPSVLAIGGLTRGRAYALRFSYRETPASETDSEEVQDGAWLPVIPLAYRLDDGDRMEILPDRAAFGIPADYHGRLIVDLSRTGLPEMAEGDLKIEFFGAEPGDTGVDWDGIPAPAEMDSFTMRPDEQVNLPAVADWLDCQLSWSLEKMEEGQWEEYASGFDFTSTNEKLQMTHTEAPAGTYRLSLSWLDSEDQTFVYGSRCMFVVTR